MMERLGKLLAHIPIDSHELGDLVSVEDRVEAIEAKLDGLLSRVRQLERIGDTNQPQAPPKRRDHA